MKTVFSQCNAPAATGMPADAIGRILFAVLTICLTLSMTLATIMNAGFRDIVYQSALDGGAAWAGATASLGEIGGNAAAAGLLPAFAGNVRTASASAHPAGN